MTRSRRNGQPLVGIVTLNPCVDKTLFLDSLPAEGIHTAEKATFLAGGKGNNVSRVLGRFGVRRKSLEMIAGATGEHIRRLLEEEGLPVEFVEVPGLSRVITTIVGRDWRQLAVKEVGPQVALRDVERIKERFLAFIEDVDFLCLSGTISCETLWDFPAWAIRQAKGRGLPVSFDNEGEAFVRGLAAAPDIVKPNDDEVRQAWGSVIQSPGDGVPVIRRMLAQGIAHPIISLGGKGALAACQGEIWHVLPPPVRLVNPVGSGDCFMAALLFAYTTGLEWRECLRWGTAAGAANAARWEAAGIGLADIRPLLDGVKFHALEKLSPEPPGECKTAPRPELHPNFVS
ncbi:MAG: hexose kinase [Terrimicrobiaceae bacterium]